MRGSDFAVDWDEWDIPYLQELFGVKDNGPPQQELGSVSLQQGRLLAFPHCLYHLLEPFELVDKAHSRHYRFLTLLRVDPYYRICSTRNMPPQRLHWWEQDARSHLSSAHPVPRELADQIIAETGLWLMGLQETQHHRRERAKDEALGHEAERNEIKRDVICLVKQF
ncbi:uncharacterized protein ACLA_020230 [Aspergillus clavatus NRRL 1]|uniref:DUF4246 domain-containing protein n=1 Tax=Aspergillus clavatus (strain ATCC 1007 / CBS 513.65 / DSM 816 / NCTC 3887 / NRRL 1 / QM 1276 / 107) TaxID=344612 RepID=A1CNU5_ASPCL|nr:uncharacterized protein ACLA_020230 [Aspergillus clavatus NRRL 1]EAW07316.1 hypothetical protein ACLA_020230 [Aspergillus clavatus NRRL 1]